MMASNWPSYQGSPLLSSTQLSNDRTGARNRISAYASPDAYSQRGGFTTSGSRILPAAEVSTIGSRTTYSGDGSSRRNLSSLEARRGGSGYISQQSPVKVFDHAVRSELLRWKKGCQRDTEEERDAIMESLATLTKSSQRISQATFFSSDVQTKTPQEELTEAVERLRRAEASVAFGGAVRAAQEAVLNAPRGLEEEAAAAGARGFGRTAKVTSVEEVHGVLDQGGKPMEVIGFVGITKPRNS